MHIDAELFVAIGFVIFVGVLGWAGAHKKLAAAIDRRVERIASELAEAERLRVEAQALLASFEKRREEAHAEAEAIVAQARLEAELLAAEARERTAEFVQRRTKQVEIKIALAEAQAMADVRAAAADAAVKLAETVLRQDRSGMDFVAAGIAEVKALRATGNLHSARAETDQSRKRGEAQTAASDLSRAPSDEIASLGAASQRLA